MAAAAEDRPTENRFARLFRRYEKETFVHSRLGMSSLRGNALANIHRYN
jgi:hypothetical protein